MLSREIPREQWVAFCQRFSRQHSGWLATIAVQSDDDEAKTIARDMALRAVSVSLEAGSNDRIYIQVGKQPGKSVVHSVEDPTAIRFVETEEGGHQGLRIESATAGTTALHFRIAAPPHEVDGI